MSSGRGGYATEGLKTAITTTTTTMKLIARIGTTAAEEVMAVTVTVVAAYAR